MDRVTSVVAKFLQDNPKYRPWGVRYENHFFVIMLMALQAKPVSRDSSLTTLPTTPPPSEPDLSQPVNPTPSSTPPIAPSQQPRDRHSSKNDIRKKKII